MRLVSRVSALVIGLLVLSAGSASAHPLGNFTVNHYAGLGIRGDGLSIDYVLDLAEIPAFQLRGTIAPDPSAACAVLARDLAVTLDGAALALRVDAGTVSFNPGQAGLETLRLECGLSTRWTLDSTPHQLTFADRSYPDRIGWREFTARADDVSIDTVLPATSRSARLTAYPQDAYSSSPDARTAEVRITPGASNARQTVSVSSPVGQGDLFLGLFGGLDVGSLPGLFAIAVAAALGALHAATPGHGKTIMAAYLVGTRRSLRDAVTLGLTVAVAHTAGVLTLAVVVIGGATVFPAERVYPMLSAISAVVVVALGLGMLRRELSHRAAHRHEHDHTHTASAGATSLVALGLAGGLVPSASALVLLLGALAAHRPELGVLLVAGFGLGMAATLVGAGVALVAAGRVLDRAPLASRVMALAPLVTAVAVLAVGLGLTAQSLSALL
jgi:ABC-type nickel/cobalt efflux system permease component RcnA